MRLTLLGVIAVVAAILMVLVAGHDWELARQGLIPAYPLGTGSRRVWRFRLAEVAAALRASSVNYPRQSPAPEEETT